MTFEAIKKQRPSHLNPPNSGLQAENGGNPPQADVGIVIALRGNVESNSYQILVLYIYSAYRNTYLRDSFSFIHPFCFSLALNVTNDDTIKPSVETPSTIIAKSLLTGTVR